MPYTAPIDDMRFVLDELCGLTDIAGLPGYGEEVPELVQQILSEAGRLASERIAPLNRTGDREGCLFENGVVRMPTGFKEAYRAYAEGGWNGVRIDTEFGGMGLPWVLANAVQEMWQSANMSFGLCPLLNQSATDLLIAHGSDEQKNTFLPKLIAGEWTGTMNLTEPQAGSDLGALRTRAIRDGRHYRLHGQKIFISYGEHDLAENIVHLVLARTEDAPPGTRGISLFIVPKFLVNEDGTLGRRNDLRCVSLEHKLGIHASPTAVMAYGDNEGATAYLVGDENQGLRYMFTMINIVRLGVGLQGVAVAERAYQRAAEYARTRVQSRAILDGDRPVHIIQHPDVRRMLMTMRAQVEATRALVYYAMAAVDRAKRHPDEEIRRHNQARVDLLTPVAKAWCTDAAVEVASLGIQVHGGMGYIEETGAAQYYRDVRVTSIYEGTNGIQANDFLGRKLLRDDGAAMRALMDDITATIGELGAEPGEDFAAIRTALASALTALEDATRWLLAQHRSQLEHVFAGAAAYLKLSGIAAGGWLMARAALAAYRRLGDEHDDPAFLEAKIVTARFFAEHVLVQAGGLRNTIMRGGPSVMALPEASF
ncbi:MAG: acyl-CoA dehydrogenase [Alphaproteobacteria bacterium]